jgi:hypothetical protein
MSNRPPTRDIEVATLGDMLEKGMWSPTEVATIRRQLEDRKAQIAAGLGSPSQLYWTLKVQREVDADCRVRRDPTHGWMLDRWVTELDCWHPVGYIGFGGKLEEGSREKVIEDVVRPDLIGFLRSRDMQRPSYIAEKKAAAQAVQDANDAKGTDKIMAAVDRMPEKNMREFIQVEQAIHTGEKIVAHGETEAILNRMTRASEQAGQTPAHEPVVMDKKGRHGKHI